MKKENPEVAEFSLVNVQTQCRMFQSKPFKAMGGLISDGMNGRQLA